MHLSQESPGFLISDVARLLRRSLARRLESGGLNTTQARVLTFAARHPGITQSKLAELMELAPVTLARIVDQLSVDGLVERRQEPGNLHAWGLYLTAASAPQLATIESAADAIRGDVLRGLDPEQAAAMVKALRTVQSILSAT
ncbi:DNA-binding MarR family transcriptional regulator [Fluviicoccus keumensis]|uniref:DNA-binding MarR family transcriptional regulator n=1 Tax=Fluviicoccus keumensis TaxID=1435465 RepID=A0A4Q7ZB38_9GAMM|nr:MarR family transcriptional regulator [Fluviicoccus keumensis]RZU47135.1 DNA-binding MarR family transcriptional regulator [Fluviicoccus keumensis]